MTPDSGDLTPGDIRDLSDAVREQNRSVHELGKQFDILDRQVKRTKMLADRDRKQIKRNRVVNIVLVLVMIALVINYTEQRNAVAQNARSAKVQCENANERTQRNLILWQVILSANADTQTPKQRHQSAVFGEWVKKLFAPRDCDHLSKKVSIPPPPDLKNVA